jgi:hypothetical protein
MPTLTEVVPHSNNHGDQLAEYAQSKEELVDPALRRDYFEHINASDFIGMTQEIASIVRTGDSEHRQHFDGDAVKLMGHEVPDHRDKEDLLRETWETAQGFLKDRNLSDEDALEYAALTTAGGILLAHPFADGNGRTSRYLSYVIAKGGQNPEVLANMTPSGSTEWQVAPGRGIMLPKPREYKQEQPSEIEWEMQFAGESEDALGGVIADSIYQDGVIREFIESADESTRSLIETCATRDGEGRMTSLDGDKLLEVLVNDSEQGLANAYKLMSLKREFQKDYVRRYLAAMRDDSLHDKVALKKYDLTDPSERAARTPNDVEKFQAISKVVGSRAIQGRMRFRDQAVAEHRGYSDLHRLDR